MSDIIIFVMLLLSFISIAAFSVSLQQYIHIRQQRKQEIQRYLLQQKERHETMIRQGWK